MKSLSQVNSIKSLALKDALHQNNRWIVADIDRKFMRPYHLMSKKSTEDQLKE